MSQPTGSTLHVTWIERSEIRGYCSCIRGVRSRHARAKHFLGPWKCPGGIPSMKPQYDFRTRRYVQYRRKSIWRSRSPSLAVVLAAAVALVFAAIISLLPQFRPAPPTTDGPSPVPNIEVIDGDTVRIRGQTYRLAGFDAPEADARCYNERVLADRATRRLSELVSQGDARLTRVRCPCPRGTEGTSECNFGRLCGRLTVRGRDVALTMIESGLARPYVCGATSCPPRRSWCG